VVLGPKKLEIQEKKCENCKRAGKDPNTVPLIEQNPSKDRAMHWGDNP
jgi:hypothetical protein